jgi:hypothetical protein
VATGGEGGCEGEAATAVGEAVGLPGSVAAVDAVGASAAAVRAELEWKQVKMVDSMIPILFSVTGIEQFRLFRLQVKRLSSL